MSRQFRSTRAGVAAVTGAAALLTALIVVAVAAARPLGVTGHAAPLVHAGAAAAHPCLVMTGSGDPAFVKSFTPSPGTAPPGGRLGKGGACEGRTVPPGGGKPTQPWLARSWKWSNGNK